MDRGTAFGNGQRAEIVWTKDDFTAFEKAAGEKDRVVFEAVLFCSVTGLRREDLARVTWSDVGEYAIVKEAMKISRRRRHLAAVPRILQLNDVLVLLEGRYRAPGVDTVLVNPHGEPWNLDTLSKEVTRVAKLAGIMHVDFGGKGGGQRRRRKHLHDVRGTFVTYLMTETDLSDAEIASIMAWSVEEVTRIRRIYVDDTARQIALGKRIARGLTPQ